ncbi:MAG: sulfotransferase family protein [Nitrososphaeraceae archaeon]
MDENIDRNGKYNNDDCKVQKPIFVTGAPRSGLGIIHQILTSHHQVTSITPNSVRRIIPHFKQRNNIQELRSFLKTSLLSLFLSRLRSLIRSAAGNRIQYSDRKFWNEYIKPYIHATNSDVTDEIANYYRSMVSQIQHINNRPRFVSTMPEHSFRVLALNKIFPDAKFIHIIRNQRIVSCSTFVKSMDEKSISNDDPYFHNLDRILGGIGYNVSSESSELVNYELAVQIIIARAREAISFRGQRYLELHYEDLVSDPRQSLIRILSFCELSQNHEFVRNMCMNIRNENEKWYLYLNKQNV